MIATPTLTLSNVKQDSVVVSNAIPSLIRASLFLLLRVARTRDQFSNATNEYGRVRILIGRVRVCVAHTEWSAVRFVGSCGDAIRRMEEFF